MPPEDRFVPRFAAEPPQDLLPYGRWAQTLTEEFLAACLRIDIVPRLTHMAGLELGTGVHLNIVAPEHAAAQLREV